MQLPDRAQNAGTLGTLVEGANTLVFYVVKAAMEYSKSPQNPLQLGIGLICNLFRVMNNVHPFIPLAFIALVLSGLGWATLALLK